MTKFNDRKTIIKNKTHKKVEYVNYLFALHGKGAHVCDTGVLLSHST